MITADGEQHLKTSVQPRLQMELSLLKMASMAHAVDLREALKKLDDLEKHVQNAPIVKGDVVKGDVAKESERDSSSSKGPVESEPVVIQRQVPVAPSEGLASDVSNSDTTPANTVDVPPPPMNGGAEAEESSHLSIVSTPVLEPEPNPKPQTPNPEPQTPNPERFFGTPALKKVPRASRGGSEPVAAVQEVAVAVSETAVAEVEWIKGSWDAYSSKIKQEKIHVSALLQHTAPLDIRDATLVLSVPDEFHKRMLGSQSEYLLTVLKEFVDLDVNRISFVIDLAKAEEKAASETAKEIDPYEYMQKKRKDNPVIKAIFDEFGGEMVW